MAFLNKLERIFGRFAIAGLPLILVVGQVLAWLALYLHRLPEGVFLLVPAQLAEMGWWHLFSFVILPPLALVPSLGLIFMIFGWWIFYMMGSALEGFWGTFRFNLFLLSGYVLTVGLSFVYPEQIVTNLFLMGSVFLAFAYLNPDFEMMLFLVLPVKIKWLALFAWLEYGWQFIRGDGAVRLQVVAIVVNFLLFFGHDVWMTLRWRGKKITAETVRIARVRAADEPRHKCRICGRTDATDPQMDFRYCSKCVGDPCYCADHIFTHEHVTAEADPKKTL